MPFLFSEVNKSVRAYGVGGHRHVAEMEQEVGLLASEPLGPIDFLPHLIPMTRGILAACHVRPTRPVGQAELDDLYATAYGSERFVELAAEPPATKHVLGSNYARVHVHADDRTGRILVLSAIDNLVKGAAGQADPGVQRRLRAARGDRPRAASALAVTRPSAPSPPIIVKLGGVTLAEQHATLEGVADAARGQPLVIVHGGGKRLSGWLERLGVQSRFRGRAPGHGR